MWGKKRKCVLVCDGEKEKEKNVVVEWMFWMERKKEKIVGCVCEIFDGEKKKKKKVKRLLL